MVYENKIEAILRLFSHLSQSILLLILNRNILKTSDIN